MRSLPLIHIPRSSVYNLGDALPSHKTASGPTPVIRNLQWTVNDDEAWAVVSSGGGKENIFKMLLGHLRLTPSPPPPGGLFPLLSLPSTSHDSSTLISFVSFRHHSLAGGAFYDFTARYGAAWDESQRVTLLESMFPRFLGMRREKESVFAWQRDDNDDSDIGRHFSSHGSEPQAGKLDEIFLTEEERPLFEAVVEKTGLKPLLDVPVITLSNGQMRRARIAKAVLKKPELMLLDEPLTGLDHESRPRILNLLKELHVSKEPRVMVGLRPQDEIPEWITHVAFVNKGNVEVGRKEDVAKSVQHHVTLQKKIASFPSGARQRNEKEGKVVVDIKNANIAYRNRKVLTEISWTIRLGERWHLQGPNGSGKSTLLALLTGAHPLSYSLPHLQLYGQKRARIPTLLMQSRVGEVSPELCDAFPRRIPGMTVWAVVGTGFEGTFVERGREGVGVCAEEGGLGIGIRRAGSNELLWDGEKGEEWDEVREWRINRCWEVLEALGPAAWDGDGDNTAPRTGGGISPITKEFAKRRFSELSRGEQRVVLLMRALVGRPPLVLLDESLSGMSEGMVSTTKRYIAGAGLGHDQVLVAISHREDELPLDGCLETFRLE